VQTGKALRASQKDGRRNLAQVHTNMRSRIPDSIETFQYALDDLESEIVSVEFAFRILLRGCLHW
jgi:hypothetical protein